MSVIFRQVLTTSRSNLTRSIINGSNININNNRNYSIITKIESDIPKPTETVPDVLTFLTKIGRKSEEHADVFENKWETFWSMDSKKMKDAGIDAKDRKYILSWRERFRKGLELQEFKESKKKHGGERREAQYASQKVILDRIALAQLKKKYKKQASQEIIQKKKWEKLHSEASHKL